MKRTRIFLFVGLAGVVALAAAGVRFIRALPQQALQEIKRQLPSEVSLGPARWAWPTHIAIQGVTVSNPPGSEGPFLFKAERLLLQIPWWGIFFSPMPVEATIEKPHLKLDSNSVEWVNALIFRRLYQAGLTQAPKLGLGEEAAEEAEETSSPGLAAHLPVRTALVGLSIQEGRLEFTDPQVRAEGPLLSVAHLNLQGKLASPMAIPTIELKADGHFVESETQEKIGFLTVESRTQPSLGSMDARIQLWHGRLRDFYNVYFYAPQPFFMEAGAGGPVLSWSIRNKTHLKVSMQCLAQDLRIKGLVGEAPWNSILKALEDSPGRIDLTVTAQGRLDDPHFDVHDRLLSELDWMVRELAAAKGVKVTRRLFFGLEKPAAGEVGQGQEEPEQWQEQGEPEPPYLEESSPP